MSTKTTMKTKTKSSPTIIPSRSLTPQRRPLLPQHMDEVPTSRDRSLHHTLTEPGFGHDFSQIRVHSDVRPPESETALNVQSVAESCRLALSSPRFCPFGGACHSCPPRIQTKLTIGQPNDRYEQEANRVADQVMRMPEPSCRECEEEEELGAIQMKRADVEEVGPNLVNKVLQHKGNGRSLEPDVTESMESRFGYDFSDIRIHIDSNADRLTSQLGAEAFTFGRNIYFGAGIYNPRTSSGQLLLAHELTHVIQQGSAAGSAKGITTLSQPRDIFEREALSSSEHVANSNIPVLEGGSPNFSQPIRVRCLTDSGPIISPSPIAPAAIAALALGALATCILTWYFYALERYGHKNDKWLHCYTSCKIATWCPPFTLAAPLLALLVGAVKELADIVIGEAEMADFIADAVGIACAAKFWRTCYSCSDEEYPD